MNDEKYCPKCGQECNKESKFCFNCGYNFKLEHSSSSKKREKNSSADTRMGTPENKPKVIMTMILCLLLIIVAVGISSSLIYDNKERAHQRYLESSELKARNEKKAKESKQESLESSLANSAKSVVTNMVQNDQNIDAKCTDVTITSHDYGNEYSGYANLEDDEGDSTTVDITVTNVKYDDSVSVDMDGDQVDKIADEFSTNN